MMEDHTSFYTSGDRKRLLDEEDEIPSGQHQRHQLRDPFDRDYARVLHSASLRRLRNKPQLFPSCESDVFRTRLTHSFEVSQIAQALARQAAPGQLTAGLSLGLINMAGLAHDIGHPPFGRTGERALNAWMKDAGGFEGNAQTLRVLARLEKKRKGFGLNLTCRSLAAIVKKDAEIGTLDEDGQRVKKGYYRSERKIVRQIREQVLGKDAPPGSLRTIECSIMDAADDIAFSTSDLEDSLKGGFVSLMDMLACSHQLAVEVMRKIRNDSEAKQLAGFTAEDVKRVLRELAAIGLALVPDKQLSNRKDERAPHRAAYDERSSDEEISDEAECADGEEEAVHGGAGEDPSVEFISASNIYRKSEKLGRNSRYRTAFTSELVKTLMRGVSIVPCDPACLSRVVWSPDALEKVMVLKHFVFFSVIKTPAIQAWEANGARVVGELCRLLWADPEGGKLPADWRHRYADKVAKAVAAREALATLEASQESDLDGEADEEVEKRKKKKREELEKKVKRWEARAKRDICDFVAGMTDNYAVEFYGRLTSLEPTTIYKKL